MGSQTDIVVTESLSNKGLAQSKEFMVKMSIDVSIKKKKKHFHHQPYNTEDKEVNEYWKRRRCFVERPSSTTVVPVRASPLAKNAGSARPIFVVLHHVLVGVRRPVQLTVVHSQVVETLEVEKLLEEEVHRGEVGAR